MTDIAIIGGGAAGLAAAVAAARGGAHVTVFEQKDRIGASILASGNGRCNLSNRCIEAAVYRNAPFVAQALEALPPTRVHAFFGGSGLALTDGGEGRLYPATNKASTVLDLFEMELAERDVEVVCRRMIRRVVPQEPGFYLEFTDGTMRPFDAVVMAAGGLAPGSLLPAGFSFTRPEGRLCGIKTELDQVKGLEKIRARCILSLYAGKTRELRATEQGEAQFRAYGISGIAAFNLSRFAERGDTLLVDLLPGIPGDQVVTALQRLAQRHPGRTAGDLLTGFALEPVARAVLRQAGRPVDQPLGQALVPSVAAALKGYKLTVRGFDDRNCQVHRGGFAVAAFDPHTLASYELPGLHVVGEALDVDAPCGGYNLHWAWTTGLLAGAHASGAPIARIIAG